jgi:hypothetical protein
MKKIIAFIPYVLLIGILISCNKSSNTPAPATTTSTAGASASEMALRSGMDKLWEDHIAWTRNVIFNIMDNLPGKDEAVARLLKNQEDIGNAIKPYYGDAAGDQLTALLKTHITGAADVLVAAKTGSSDLSGAQARWQANADSIATFLSNANSTNWPLADMRTMMSEHLKLTTDEALARLKKDYKADIAAYDAVHTQIMHMAGMLSDGIVKQYPDKF